MLRIERRKLSFATVDVGPNGSWVCEGRPFTGVAYTLGPDSAVTSEQTFRDGLRWGPVWERYRSGQLYYEAWFFRDVLHGRKREWYKDGQLAEEGEYEYGLPLWKRRWSETGDLIEEYQLSKTSPAFKRLEQLRQVFGAEGGRSASEGGRAGDG